MYDRQIIRICGYRISSWNDSGRQQNPDKVPSRIIYDDKGEVTDWGFATPTDRTTLVPWFKFLLSDEALRKGGEKVAEAQAALKRLKKDAVDVVAVYLRQLWLHAVERIELKLTQISFENMDIRVVLTAKSRAFDNDWEHGIKRAYAGSDQTFPVNIVGFKQTRWSLLKDTKLQNHS
ncbi:uncharacterized protein A1O5_06255 [Cladophialophora psammophila CBS 110553]|uniref:Uncharacterized protein n=1 Tax=Cladophialophora psammophila CBS 110553 TaxID=1182543 RepID=W9WPR6_9EURO|nr:uncharacterized protein A1O5_06255 [Cladophialophora psammophila CBS 110553]EXJ70187.1 hypothetical protein A1O5_06255 [Cladophialophora psammophila CBS 110553]